MHALVALALVFLPSVAAACPACLGQQNSFSTTLKLIGLFILFPFLVAALVLREIRKAQRDHEDD